MRTARSPVSCAVRGSLPAALALVIVAAPGALAQTTSEYTGTGENTAVLDEVVTRDAGGAGVGGAGAGVGGAGVGTGSVVTPSTLPFTGGEVVLISLAGAAAVAAGAAMVVGGRRRLDADV